MTRLKRYVLRPHHKEILYGISALLWLSGAVWLYFRYYPPMQGEFGVQSHPAQTLCLKLHGAAAMGFLVILGMALYHIPPGWRKKRQRPSGVSLLVVSCLLILTGWGLYYTGNDQLRSFTSLSHSILGVLLPVIIFFHVWRIVQRRSKKKVTTRRV